MARLHNSRIKTTTNTKTQEYVRPTISKIKTFVSEMSLSNKTFLISMFLLDLISIVLIGIFSTSITQSIFLFVLFLVNVIAATIFSIIIKKKIQPIVNTIFIFFIIIALVSVSFQIYGSVNPVGSQTIKKEIDTVKNNSTLIISTDVAEIYLDTDSMTVYSITNIADQKYVNANYLTPAQDSEYYFLYNVGIQMSSPMPAIQEMYLYPPTPHTVTSYEYLLEIKYNNELYITKVFLPGYVDLTKSTSSIMFVLTYANTDEKYYVVNRLDDYFIFQSDYSTFSTQFENVKYTSEQEYFYVRYNRYLAAYMESEDYDEIDEKNVRFAKTLLTMSTTIKKINFFWIGEEVNGQFVASIPVMEIVYDNGTCDIAIIKDISPESLGSAVT